MAEKYLIVGLGNPGRKYKDTRHNAGFWVVEELARRWGWEEGGRTERKAKVVDGIVNGKKILLAKPQTYMNLSGESIRALVDFHEIDLERLMIVYDDLDTPFGTLRIRKIGGHGGNNGMRNIIQRLGTKDFARIRFGIGRPPGKMRPMDYVLKPFMGDDKIQAQEMVDRAANAIEKWLKDGVEQTMTDFNGDSQTQDELPKIKPKDELKRLTQAHEEKPDDPKPLEKMATILKRLGKLDEAVQRHLQSADLYEQQGKLNKAITHRERAASIRPDSAKLQHLIAENYLSMNIKKKAVNRYLIFADILAKQGDDEQALENVEQALAINPQHPKALEMQKLLEEKLS